MPAATLATLVARDLEVTLGATTVLDGVSLIVAPGDRIGVIAPNGTGKTTLLRTLAGSIVPDAGTVTATPPDAVVGYLRQEPERRPDETVRDAIARRTGVTAASGDLDGATAALAAGTLGADDRYATALDRWLVLGGADLDTRIGEVWAELALSDRLLDQATDTLSGGEAARASLAAVLLSRFDVLLLDEPTNDLDFAALERLERFVTGRDGAVVLVSHDRAFLERTVTAVVELDDHARTASRFEGGWAAYLEEQAVARRHAEEAYAVYSERRGDLSGRIQRQKQWTVVGVKKAKSTTEKDKNIRHHKKATSEKQAAKISQSEKALERLAADAVDKPWEGWELRLELAEAPRSGRVVARLEGAVVTRGSFVLGPVDVEVEWADRVAVLGPNGAGKTTLIDALLGRAELAAGTSYVGPGVVVGEIDQRRSRLHDDIALAAAFQADTGLDRSEVRTLLAKFGLGADHVARTAAELSPGERTRAVLAVLQAKGANCLVLDEPTNHLDLAAIAQLEQAVEAFSGTVLLVTHDRRLLEAVRVTRTLRVEDGQVTE